VNLEYSDLSDALDFYEIPRIEKINEHVVLFVRHPIDQRMGLYTTTFAMVLTPDYFITICPQRSHIVESFLRQPPRYFSFEKPQLLIHTLLKITQNYTLEIKKIRTNVLKQEKKMSSVDSRDITALTLNEENLNQYLSSLVPMRTVLEAITSGRYTFLYEKEQDLLEDLRNASLQSEELCSINIRSISSLRDSYQILFTNQLNKTIKMLTALTIILSVPTMIASLYGMNVPLPFESQAHSFTFILAFLVMISGGLLFLFHRKRWF
ncbi:MAG: magnesium transporter CorA family protein, partial [Chlamydiota bacterium]|nr:magnesium transporter CorA family protein [Chlamydiota bacterium]